MKKTKKFAKDMTREEILEKLEVADNPFILDANSVVEEEKANNKLTQDNIRRLEHCFSLDCTVVEACAFANISGATFYDWMKKNPKLDEHLKRLREKPMLKARLSMYRGLNDHEFALKYAERKRSSEFSTKQTIDNNNNVTITSLRELEEINKKKAIDTSLVNTPLLEDNQ